MIGRLKPARVGGDSRRTVFLKNDILMFQFSLETSSRPVGITTLPTKIGQQLQNENTTNSDHVNCYSNKNAEIK